MAANEAIAIDDIDVTGDKGSSNAFVLLNSPAIEVSNITVADGAKPYNVFEQTGSGKKLESFSASNVKVDDASYTKWFQLTDDIYIVDSIGKEKPNHTFLNSSNTNKVTANTTNFTDLYYNSNEVSDKAISINIEYLESTNYEQYQIGYIIRHNSDVRGRIYSEFSINETVINVVLN